MNEKRPTMDISYGMYRYAPESFRDLRVYNRPFALPNDKLRELGYFQITQGTVACIAAIKRAYRMSLKKRIRCTIGFMLEGSKREFCYCGSLYAYDDDLYGKLRVYKDIKHFLRESGGRFLDGKTATLGAGYEIEQVRERYGTADLSRPVKIYFAK
jgi:hypothetical protein